MSPGLVTLLRRSLSIGIFGILGNGRQPFYIIQRMHFEMTCN